MPQLNSSSVSRMMIDMVVIGGNGETAEARDAHLTRKPSAITLMTFFFF